MPLLDVTTQQTLPLQVAAAYTWLTRMVGLLNQHQPEFDVVTHIKPCTSVHTFGMHFPIDIVALDRTNRVVGILPEVAKNKIVSLPRSTYSILEGAPGWMNVHKVQLGQRLRPVADRVNTVNWQGLRHLFHWPLNFFIALLWCRLVLYLLQAWQQHHQAITFGLLIHNTLLLVLFLSRRESRDTSTRLQDWLIPFATIACAMFLQPMANTRLAPALLAAGLQVTGILAMLYSLFSLGRSFGVVPANRNLKLAGAYKFVRHPLYASELIFYLGFLLGNFSPHNTLLLLCICAGQLWRAAAEEKLLQKENLYQTYLKTVRYRFIPGLY